jgi:LacI family transcriptional regulator
VQHLAALGHRRIAFVSGPLRMRTAVTRRDAFRKSMTELGLTVPGVYIVEGDHKMEGGKAAMEKLIALAELPTAVICSNDMTAIGVLHALDETTLKVPADLSGVGFDDIRLAQFMLPPLTTVQMSCKELATAAVQALRAAIEPAHPQSTQKEWPVATRLVVRRSTDFPRGTLPALGKRRPNAARRG